MFFFSSAEETGVPAGWGRAARRESPLLPESAGARALLPQSRFSSKLLPGLPGGKGPKGPRPGGSGAAGAPRGSHRRSARLWARVSCPALPSGPEAGARGEKERDGERGCGRGDARGPRLGDSGTRGLGEGARKRQGAGRGARNASAPRRRTAPAPAGCATLRGRTGAAGPGQRRPGQGAARAGVGYLPGRRADWRAVSGGARGGRQGPCGARGTAAATEGHREEARHVEAPPAPAPARARRDEEEEGGAPRLRVGAGLRGSSPPGQRARPRPARRPSPHFRPRSAPAGTALRTRGSAPPPRPPARGSSRGRAGPRRAPRLSFGAGAGGRGPLPILRAGGGSPDPAERPWAPPETANPAALDSRAAGRETGAPGLLKTHPAPGRDPQTRPDLFFSVRESRKESHACHSRGTVVESPPTPGQWARLRRGSWARD